MCTYERVHAGCKMFCSFKWMYRHNVIISIRPDTEPKRVDRKYNTHYMRVRAVTACTAWNLHIQTHTRERIREHGQTHTLGVYVLRANEWVLKRTKDGQSSKNETDMFREEGREIERERARYCKRQTLTTINTNCLFHLQLFSGRIWQRRSNIYIYFFKRFIRFESDKAICIHGSVGERVCACVSLWCCCCC